MKITALHGFLGRGSDWDFLRDAGFDVVTPSLDAVPSSGDVLLGYSMGGRLALHALLRGATYNRAVFVSTGLGLESGRAERAAADERWAERFERDEWSSLMRDWNAQPVFGGHEVTRDEREYDRSALARALREWSPGVLPPVAARLHELTIPTLWIAGARDTKYVAEAERGASLAARGERVVIPNAGHRVPWEAPDAFIAVLRQMR